MQLKSAPMSDPVVDKNGQLTGTWHQFINRLVKTLNLSRPWELPAYQVSGAPLATENEGCLLYLSNESGGKTLAFSDGVNWRRVQDRAIIS